MHDFHQVALCMHDGVDVLVCHRDLIDDAIVLATLDTGGGPHLVFAREAALGFAAAHRATRAMAATGEALLVALAPHDVAARAHRAGNDPQLALLRRDGALAGHQHVLAEVALLLHIVVVAVDRFHVGL